VLVTTDLMKKSVVTIVLGNTPEIHGGMDYKRPVRLRGDRTEGNQQAKAERNRQRQELLIARGAGTASVDLQDPGEMTLNGFQRTFEEMRYVESEQPGTGQGPRSKVREGSCASFQDQ
jgi:hypothetical protein